MSVKKKQQQKNTFIAKTTPIFCIINLLGFKFDKLKNVYLNVHTHSVFQKCVDFHSFAGYFDGVGVQEVAPLWLCTFIIGFHCCISFFHYPNVSWQLCLYKSKFKNQRTESEGVCKACGNSNNYITSQFVLHRLKQLEVFIMSYIITQSCKFIPALIKTYLTCINLQNYT